MSIRLVIIALLLLMLPAGYFFCLHSEKTVVAELIDASQRKDAEAFSRRVDWESLRTVLKADISGQKAAMGNLGAGIGPELSQVGALVDFYVKQENVAALFYYHETLLPQVKEEDFIDGAGYWPFFGFYVTLAYPASNPMNLDMGAMMHEKLRVRVFFGLDGLTWKLKGMHVPLFMTPAQTRPLPDAAAMKTPKH